MSNVPGEVRIAADPRNPGEFFACCGLLELADRLWPGAEGWFASGKFHAACGGSLRELVKSVLDAPITLEGPADEAGKKDIYSRPGKLGRPFDLTIDWWLDADLLRDGSVIAALMTGDRKTAIARFRGLTPWSTRSPTDLRSRLLYAYVSTQ